MMTSAPLAHSDTLMSSEAAEAGAAVRRMIDANAATLAALGSRLRDHRPPVVVTCARGSSDHAATYGKYLIETLTGVPVASAAPSVASIYAADVATPGALCIAISQSGRSADLLASVAAQRAGGAHVVALVNDEASPLAQVADTLVPLKAGPERSVAATKSYIAALAALALLAAEWAGDAALRARLETLPDALAAAWERDWTAPALPVLCDAASLFVVGRGYGLGIAQEAALKLKETSALHAEAFSAAEVRHGPMELVNEGFPVLAFATSDSAGDGVREGVAEFAARGAHVLLADAAGSGALPAATDHPAIEPILMIQSFYRMADALSLARGRDPDSPRHLSKVTSTL